MKIYKTLVGFSDGDGTIFKCDTIEYEGKLCSCRCGLKSQPKEGSDQPD